METARSWLNVVASESKRLETDGHAQHDMKEVLTLTEDQTIEWRKDERWDEVMRLKHALPGEDRAE